MFRSFEEILQFLKDKGIRKTLAVAAAEDEPVLTSVIAAYDVGIIDPVFVGLEEVIQDKIRSLDRNPLDFRIIDQRDPVSAANYVAEMMANGTADIPMKGLLQTGQFLKALLNKELGLIPSGALISQASVVEVKKKNRLEIISDCAISIFPDLEQKRKIITNTIFLAKRLGCEVPKIAILAPIELVNPDIPVTVEASKLTEMAKQGLIKDAIIDGPLALDNAISLEAAQHKGIQSEVAGKADVLIVPDLLAGNILHKAVAHIAELPTAGIVLGAKCPIVMTSRTDTARDKFNSILLGVMLAS